MITSLAASGARLDAAQVTKPAGKKGQNLMEQGAGRAETHRQTFQAAHTARMQVKNQQSPPKKTATMPSFRFWSMIGVALIFDSVQILTAIMFISPTIPAALIGALGGTAACMSILSLSETACAVIGAASGAATGALAAALDVVSAGSLTAFSTSLGQLISTSISVSGITLFTLWFVVAGIPFFSGKNATRRLGALMTQSTMELVPFLGAMPLFTVTVAYICTQARKEGGEG